MTGSWTDTDESLMGEALAEGLIALERGEVPVGCIIVDSAGNVIARAHNDTVASRNATRHCEFVAVDSILQRDPTFMFQSCSLYVTCEPCIMCASLLSQVEIGTVLFGCFNERFGGNGSVYNIEKVESGANAYKVVSGLRKQEAVQLFKAFYENGNPNAPEPKRARPLVDK